MKRRSVATLLSQVLGSRRASSKRQQPAAPRGDTVQTTDCAAHLFERVKGGRRCKFCGAPPALSRVNRLTAGARVPRVREALPEKEVQRQVVSLFRSIGCRYDAHGENTDIYVLGTRRPRHLPSEAHRTYQTPGIADLFIFLPLEPRWPRAGARPPACVWFEVKAEDGKPSDPQLSFEARCQVRGVPHVMGGVADAEQFLELHGFWRRAA